MSGTGKCSLIKSILSESKITHVWIDCIKYQGELEICKCIKFDLEDIFHNASEIEKMKLNFISVAEIIKKKIDIDKPLYLIFSKISRLWRTELFKKLLALKNMLKSYIHIIFISDEYIPSSEFCNEFVLLENGITNIQMPELPFLHLEAILKERYGAESQKEVFTTFLSIVYQNFGTYIGSINYYDYLCKTLFPVYIEPLKKGKTKEELYTKEFIKAMEDKIKSLYIPIYEPLPNLESDEETKSDKEINKSLEMPVFEETFCEKTTKIGLTYLESILLISTYIACYNPQQTDILMFSRKKSVKRSIGKSKKREQVKPKCRKADLDRIASIAEYFLDFVDTDSMETKGIRHTNWFYSQLNNLVDYGYLKNGTYKENVSTPFYQVMLEYSFVEKIANELEIRLFEYMAIDVENL